jgi:hypothetical protein
MIRTVDVDGFIFVSGFMTPKGMRWTGNEKFEQNFGSKAT